MLKLRHCIYLIEGIAFVIFFILLEVFDSTSVIPIVIIGFLSIMAPLLILNFCLTPFSSTKEVTESSNRVGGRYITEAVKNYVWRRDMGRCVECGSKELLEYDHIIPFSKGGSNTARNIQLLCEKCNRSKNNKI